MAQLQAMITELVAEVKRMCAFDTMCSPKGRVYRSESMTLLLGRWQKLEKDFYNDKADTFDISKIPDIYDCIKYDLVHNSHLMLKGQNELFRLARELARLVVSQEYGMTSEEKLNIGTKMPRTI
jgi:inositol hexakisphosphate/diphosphoinositol-pentakisphosphate kinase